MSEETDEINWDPNTPCVLGIDEAGRGPVLGPMVYATAICPVSRLTDLRALGANDSKALKEEHRDELRKKIQKATFLRTFERVLTASFLSESMLRKEKYNLNLVSHDAAIGLVQKAIDHGINVAEIYVDTVGNPEQYAAKFRERFSAVEKVVVAKKADATYPIVGAASIVAKTTRDRHIREWAFPEQHRSAHFECGGSNMAVEFLGPTGSGYPSDPITKTWIEHNVDELFGFPTFVRFSWGTAKAILDKNAVRVEWECDEEDEEVGPKKVAKKKKIKTKDIKSFFPTKPTATTIGIKKHKAFKSACPLPQALQSMALRRASKLA